MYHIEKLKRVENTPELETERLILRRFREGDEQALLDIFGDKKVNIFLPMFPLKSLEEAHAYLVERYLDFYEQEACGYRYAVCLKENPKRVIGYMGVGDNESHDTGWGMHRDFWGQGIATEGARAMVERVREAGLPYITATHDRNNPRSGRVMQKIGMTYRYSYKEQCQPKNFPVIFRMYQLDLNGTHPTYDHYKTMYPVHFVETRL